MLKPFQYTLIYVGFGLISLSLGVFFFVATPWGGGGAACLVGGVVFLFLAVQALRGIGPND